MTIFSSVQTSLRNERTVLCRDGLDSGLRIDHTIRDAELDSLPNGPRSVLMARPVVARKTSSSVGCSVRRSRKREPFDTSVLMSCASCWFDSQFTAILSPSCSDPVDLDGSA